MSDNQCLLQNLKENVGKIRISQELIPDYITKNLRHSLYEWQEDALRNFLALENYGHEFRAPPAATHLMFNMATGSGKTLLMAALMLYYYKKGKRRFLFFANRTNIVEKTSDNFVNSAHGKYLFRKEMEIGGAPVRIKKVDTFSDDPQSLEIKFTSIQGLHRDVLAEKENETTLQDLQAKDLVMLADEAHHLNSETLKGARSYESVGWEQIVIDSILHKDRKTSNGNVLLEFTATMPDDEGVSRKYKDKIIYKFDLKEFLQKGYAKEISLISSTLCRKDRVLHALLFTWYRHEVARRNGIRNFKPVILFRSKDIANSEKDYEDFLEWVDEISGPDFNFLDDFEKRRKQADNENSQKTYESRTKKVLDFMKLRGISREMVASWIHDSYREENVIITNSRDNQKKKTEEEKTNESIDRLLNSLEDRENSIRAIFTVQRLTEGWDVLNLFDIVRMSDEHPSNNDKPLKSTIQEKQLIGRGVRYFPFDYKDTVREKRKFDKNLEHELRALEELYFYAYDKKSEYIDSLKSALKEDGYEIESGEGIKFDLKDEFKSEPLYTKGMIAWNEKLLPQIVRKASLGAIKTREGFNPFSYTLESLQVTEEKFDLQRDDGEKVKMEETSQKIEMKFGEIDRHVIYKALHKKAVRDGANRFRLEGMSEMIEVTGIDNLRDNLKDFDIEIQTAKSKEDLNADDFLKIAEEFLSRLFEEIETSLYTFKGSEFSLKNFSEVFHKPKIKKLGSNKENREIADKRWYVLNRFVGTDEEERAAEFIQNNMQALLKKYGDVKLLKNEEVYKIYGFETGEGFQPDYILFLGDLKNLKLYYMVFIEPKGSHLRMEQEWKEKFLAQISEKYGHLDQKGKVLVSENSEYSLYVTGLPFYNKDNLNKFEREFDKIVERRKQAQ